MSSAKALALGSAEPRLRQKSLLRLYSMRFCPYATRIRIILLVKKIPCEIININLSSKPDWFLAKNPQGKVPALEVDGNIIWESLIIANYLDDAFREPKLWPQDPLERAQGLMILENLSKLVTLSSDFYKKDAEFSKTSEAILYELQYYESMFTMTKRPYFGGDRPGMVDYMLWPFFELLDILVFMRTVLMNKEPFFPLITKDNPHLLNWIQNMRENPVIKQTAINIKTGAQFYFSLMNECPDYDLEP